MIWNILRPRGVEVVLPRHLNTEALRRFVGDVVDEHRDCRSSTVTFNFGELHFIEPVGVVVLCNLIEYLRTARVRIRFNNHLDSRECIRYLDDSQFFVRYLKRTVFAGAAPRVTTVPLQLIAHDESVAYLYMRLIPWIARVINCEPVALESLRASLEEIFHNVNDHSGVRIGCAFAQHFPSTGQIQVAISDFGDGIPTRVRTRAPGADDADCLRLACKEGFTTKSNVQNRGAGLPNLIRFVTRANGGNVLIASGTGELTASPRPDASKITVRRREDFYPGTLVRVILREQNLRQIAATTQEEDFEW